MDMLLLLVMAATVKLREGMADPRTPFNPVSTAKYVELSALNDAATTDEERSDPEALTR
ncbi:hypothetical protein LTR42_012841 [Elasticomyces elasticus]|nr:hypothetical protein LTR42_012841 [Elasticomyces elasticus]KAK5711016.1 hypothetical protein LTR15_012662 [Elasticomyces elasticus]